MVAYTDALDELRSEQRASILQKLEAAGFAVDGEVDLAFKGATTELLRSAGLSIAEVSAVLGAQNKLSAGTYSVPAGLDSTVSHHRPLCDVAPSRIGLPIWLGILKFRSLAVC